VTGLTACSGEEESPAPPPATPTPLSSYDTTAIELERRDLCASLDQSLAARILGSPGAIVEWAPGDRLPGTDEIADEWGCRITADEATAEAWVAAPPVTAPEARRLVKRLTGMKCRAREAGADFGDPGTAYSCDLNSGATLQGHAGLFGDTWVVTRVATDDEDAAEDAADQWAVAVLTALER
jgi:hypothetical protein